MTHITKEDIKFATLDEVPQIVALGFASFKENMLGGISEQPSLEKATEVLTRAIMDDVVLVHRVDNKVAGVIALGLDHLWFAEQPFLGVLLMYVKQPHRTFNVAKSLLQAAQEYAIINDIPLVFDLFAQKDVQKKIKLLKRLGFQEYGTHMVFKG